MKTEPFGWRLRVLNTSTQLRHSPQGPDAGNRDHGEKNYFELFGQKTQMPPHLHYSPKNEK